MFYPKNAPAEVWHGLVSVDVDEKDISRQTRYVDGVKTHRRQENGSFSGTISAFTYPQSLEPYMLTPERREGFDLTYRTTKNDRIQIHLGYNLSFSPGGIFRQTNRTDPFQWNFSSLPVSVPGAKNSAHLVVDTSLAYSWTVDALSDILYGTDAANARMPSPQDVFEVFEENSLLRIIDHGDGTWTAIGPDSAIQMLDSTTFQITWPTAIYIDEDTYKISSL